MSKLLRTNCFLSFPLLKLISHFLKFEEYDRSVFQFLLTTTEVAILLEAAVITPGVEDTATAIQVGMITMIFIINILHSE